MHLYGTYVNIKVIIMMVVSITKWAPDLGEGNIHRLFIILQANIIQFILLMKKLRFRVGSTLPKVTQLICSAWDLIQIISQCLWQGELELVSIPCPNPTICLHLIPTMVKGEIWALERSNTDKHHLFLLCGMRKLRMETWNGLQAAYKKCNFNKTQID